MNAHRGVWHALAVQLNILPMIYCTIDQFVGVSPVIDTLGNEENMVVGRAYTRVRVPSGKLAAPCWCVSDGLCNMSLRVCVTEWLKVGTIDHH